MSVMMERKPVYDELLDLLVDPHPRILDFRPSSEAQARIDELLERNREGALSEEVRAELDEFEQVEHLVRLLKIRTLSKARR